MLIIAILLTLIIIGLTLWPTYQKKQAQQQRIKTLHLSKSSSKKDKDTTTLTAALSGIVEKTIQRFLPQQHLENLEHRIVIAHINKYDMQAHLGLSIICCIGITLGVLFVFMDGKPNFLGLLLSAMLGLAIPTLYIDQKIKKIHKTVIKELPQYINLLRVCIEAGLDLESAFKKLGQKYKGFLKAETEQLINEINLGKPVSKAVQDMAYRIDLPEMTALFSLVVQSASLGVSIAGILKIQSETIFNQYFQAMREKAAKVPVLMTLPIVLFILPAILLILLGPIAIIFSTIGF